jgi:putative transposase
MAQQRRPYTAGIPVHVVHRGVNRGQVFFTDDDRGRYLGELGVCLERHEIALHAYVLMDNHVHLLMTPDRDGAISALVRDVCRRYVPITNKHAGRCGTLWDGRHYSAEIHSDRYLLACYRYVELNPVRAGLVRHAAAYRWSSHRANAFDCPDSVVTPHQTYEALGRCDAARRAAYEALFHAEAATPETLVSQAARLRNALKRRPSQPNSPSD